MGGRLTDEDRVPICCGRKIVPTGICRDDEPFIGMGQKYDRIGASAVSRSSVRIRVGG